MIDFINQFDIDVVIGGHWENQNKQELIETIKQG